MNITLALEKAIQTRDWSLVCNVYESLTGERLSAATQDETTAQLDGRPELKGIVKQLLDYIRKFDDAAAFARTHFAHPMGNAPMQNDIKIVSDPNDSDWTPTDIPPGISVAETEDTTPPAIGVSPNHNVSTRGETPPLSETTTTATKRRRKSKSTKQRKQGGTAPEERAEKVPDPPKDESAVEHKTAIPTHYGSITTLITAPHSAELAERNQAKARQRGPKTRRPPHSLYHGKCSDCGKDVTSDRPVTDEAGIKCAICLRNKLRGKTAQ